MKILRKKYIFMWQRLPKLCRHVVCIFCLLCFCPAEIWGQDSVSDAVPSVPLVAEEEIQRELWTGSLYSSTYRAGVCISPKGDVRGVLLLRLKNGKVDVYHFYGTMDASGTIVATHNAGHRFEGRFKDAHTVLGKITLQNGFSVNLSGQRTRNASLTESCGPLPK